MGLAAQESLKGRDVTDTAHWNHRAGQLTWQEVTTPKGLTYYRPVNTLGKAVNYSHSFASTYGDCPRKAWFQKVACAPQGGL